MKILTEKEAEDFLEKEGFKIIERAYVKKNRENKLAKEIKKIGFPLVMKVSGKKIIHKNRIKGVKKNIKNYNQALKTFRDLTKIKNCEGIMLQKQLKGKEFLLGIKKTPEFGHVIAFGKGGIFVERFKKVSFRVCPINYEEAGKMIKEISKLNKRENSLLSKNLIRLCKLIKKYPKINELDINPLILEKGKAIIVDARIIFD